MANSQLLRNTDEVEEINALQDFGRRTEPRKNSQDNQIDNIESVLSRLKTVLEEDELNNENDNETETESPDEYKPPKKLFSTKRKDKIFPAVENKRKIVVQRKRRPKAKESDFDDEEGPKEIMQREESNRGFSKFSDTIQEQEVDKPSEKKFSKKVEVSRNVVFRPKRPNYEVSQRNVNLPGFMDVKRRGSRQSAMEEMAHAHIHKLDVDCSNSGIRVSLEFNEPFDGIVYSKGHFNDPKCT